MQYKLCLENHTPQSLLGSEVKPEVLPVLPPHEKTEGLGEGRSFQSQKINPGTLKQHDLYGIWSGMRNRCNNPNNKDYLHYGGRGIKVCDRWSDFRAFVEDMGPRPTGLHKIDRIHNDGNYEPNNCKWSTQREQMQNTRINHYLTVKGITKTLSQWAREIGISVVRIRERLERGWTPETSISAAKKRRGASRLTPEEVVQIRNDPRSAPSINKMFGVSAATICNVRKRVVYKDVEG